MLKFCKQISRIRSPGSEVKEVIRKFRQSVWCIAVLVASGVVAVLAYIVKTFLFETNDTILSEFGLLIAQSEFVSYTIVNYLLGRVFEIVISIGVDTIRIKWDDGGSVIDSDAPTQIIPKVRRARQEETDPSTPRSTIIISNLKYQSKLFSS
jgi:hypothetical protein